MQQTTSALAIRRADERGRTDWGWLDSRHTFSFGEYFDPRFAGFRSLRVINDDRVAPGAGFGTHGHRDMEILSYVLEGALEHKDSSGGGGVIRPGEIQMMRAGTGVMHSEYNHSKTEPVHFLQIWIVPDARNLRPTYAQQPYDREAARSRFVLLAAKDGREGSVPISQDASLAVTLLRAGDARELQVAEGRHAWIHVARGSVQAEGATLREGDGAAVRGPARVDLRGLEDAEVLAFDLA
jgi:redox-sensitive bicupin YhaK (pirin superfamily)